MVGTEQVAREVAAWPEDNTLSELRGLGIVPLSNGCARKVFLHNNVVYKTDVLDIGSNLREWHNYLRWNGRLPEPFVIPETSLYRVGGRQIIAMRYVQGRFPYPTDPMITEIQHYFKDAACENVIIAGGIYHVIDIDD